MPFFCESQLHNAYYNRKIAISNDGSIKNCLSIDESFGNIKINKIQDIASNLDFKKLWYINKDKIEICKDCEYRYICLDGRVPIQKGNQWTYLNECNYNPYIAKWYSEDGYKTVK